MKAGTTLVFINNNFLTLYYSDRWPAVILNDNFYNNTRTEYNRGFGIPLVTSWENILDEESCEFFPFKMWSLVITTRKFDTSCKIHLIRSDSIGFHRILSAELFQSTRKNIIKINIKYDGCIFIWTIITNFIISGI